MKRPNLRKVFAPDPGFTMYESDLKQADAQVVAWEAHDEPLMEFFKAQRSDPSLDLHSNNLKDLPVRDRPNGRQLAKQGVHLTNYGGKPFKLAKTLGITVHEAELFQRGWFRAHPAIPEWHRRVESQLRDPRVRGVFNAFGYKRTYFGRIEQLLGEALAWVPQSTVALVTGFAEANLFEFARDFDGHKSIHILLNGHDSLLYQIAREAGSLARTPDLFRRIRDVIHIEIPYPEPLTIAFEISQSNKSWGDMEEAKWPT